MSRQLFLGATQVDAAALKTGTASCRIGRVSFFMGRGFDEPMRARSPAELNRMKPMESDLCRGLPAQVDGAARVLVLGSMPGVASLHAARYYAHPRNRFWPLMSLLCGMDATLSYEQQLRALNRAGVGLWDVIGQCRRRGSLDADIVRGSEVANPLAPLIATLPRLRLIACNGAAAHRAFQRFIVPDLPLSLTLPVLALPSTSPANAAASLPVLARAWQPVADAMGC